MWVKGAYTTQLEGDLNHQRDKISDLENQQASSKTHQNLLVQQLIAQKEELAKKDKLILEWMHTNAAFKKLTKDYAAQLGISNEERIKDVDQARIDVAADEPAFQTTDIYKDAVESAKKSKTQP